MSTRVINGFNEDRPPLKRIRDLAIKVQTGRYYALQTKTHYSKLTRRQQIQSLRQWRERIDTLSANVNQRIRALEHDESVEGSK